VKSLPQPPAADECSWFHQLALTLPFIFPAEENGLKPVPLLVDNLAAISTANHPKVTSTSKHLQLRVFRLRDYQGDNNISPELSVFGFLQRITLHE